MNTPLKRQGCIEDMEELLQQLQTFEQQLQQEQHLNSPAFKQEYDMFTKYLKWRLEDFNRAMRVDLLSQINSLR